MDKNYCKLFEIKELLEIFPMLRYNRSFLRVLFLSANLKIDNREIEALRSNDLLCNGVYNEKYITDYITETDGIEGIEGD